MIKYCDLCKRDVQPKKYFSWPCCILWFLVFGFGVFVYLIYYAILKGRDTCPICGSQYLQSVSKIEKERKEVLKKLQKV